MSQQVSREQREGTHWRKSTRKLTAKYIITGAHSQSGVFKKEVKETETLMWAERVEKKGPLGIYRAGKQEIGRENFDGNNKSSALLFEARAGCLRATIHVS